jgi:hypothetical protein
VASHARKAVRTQDQQRSQMNPFGDSTPIKITKLEAARRQLVTAIRIYFANGDPVSIHTLAAAAFGILDDLDNHGSSTGTIFDQIAARITPEYVDSFREALRRPQNFFKHADRDPENILEFRPGMAGVIIWAACEKYYELTKEELLETAAFHRWILIRNPGLLLAPYRQQVERLGLSTDFTENMRPQFFEQFSVAYTRSNQKAFA